MNCLREKPSFASASAAWDLIEVLLEDERVVFVSEPAQVETVFPKLLKYPMPAGKLIGDAYLAAFSIAGQMRLATFDRGFGQFRDLDLRLLL